MAESKRGGTRVIELRVEVDAPPQAVWTALTDPEELKRWFPPDARVTPGEGGTIWLSWGPGVEGQGRIETWEPPHRFRWVEDHEQTQLAVDWEIEGRGGKSVVRLVQSGFGAGEDWDDWYEGTRRGWQYFLAHLRHYLEQHRGTARVLVSTRRRQQRGRPEAWARLLGSEGFGLAVAPEPGASCRLRWNGAVLQARVIAAEEPHTFAALLPELAEAILLVELEPGAGAWHCGIWLSTYGLPGARVRELQDALDQLADRALAES